MAAAKLVTNLLVLVLFYFEIQQINALQTNSEEEHTPNSHIVYDQRQNGKYNIHVVIKDVAIIEMDQNEIADQQNYNDEEYYYDEEDLTVKPLNVKTTTTSIKPIDSTTNRKTTTPLMISSTEGQSGETTTNYPQENASFTESTNITKTSEKTLTNVADFMTFLTTHRTAVKPKSHSKIEPIYAIEEPALEPRHHLEDFIYGLPIQNRSTVAKEDAKTLLNSKIFKVKIHRTHRAPQIETQRVRCRSYQYRDSRGNCHSKRSSSGSIL